MNLFNLKLLYLNWDDSTYTVMITFELVYSYLNWGDFLQQDESISTGMIQFKVG